jgi:hypothetical protein
LSQEIGFCRLWFPRRKLVFAREDELGEVKACLSAQSQRVEI